MLVMTIHTGVNKTDMLDSLAGHAAQDNFISGEVLEIGRAGSVLYELRSVWRVSDVGSTGLQRAQRRVISYRSNEVVDPQITHRERQSRIAGD